MVVDLDGLADRVGFAKEAVGQGLRNERGGRVRGCLYAAAEDLEAKHDGEVLLSHDSRCADGLFVVAEEVVAAIAHQRTVREEVGVLIAKGLAQRHSDDIAVDGLVLGGKAEHCFGDAVVVGRVFVETELVDDPEADEDRDSHTDGKAGDVDKAIAFALDEMAPGEEEVVLEHASDFGIPQERCQKNADLVRL